MNREINVFHQILPGWTKGTSPVLSRARTTRQATLSHSEKPRQQSCLSLELRRARRHALTALSRLSRLSGVAPKRAATIHEANVSAESSKAQAHARVPRAHENQGRPQDAQTAPSKGTKAARRVVDPAWRAEQGVGSRAGRGWRIETPLTRCSAAAGACSDPP